MCGDCYSDVYEGDIEYVNDDPGIENRASLVRVENAVKEAEEAKNLVIAQLEAHIAQLQATARAAADEAQRQRILRMGMKDTQAALNLVNAQRGFALSKGSTCTTVYADYLRRVQGHGSASAERALAS